MRSRAGAGMWIMAGGALHSATKQRNVAVAVNGVEVRRGLDPNRRRRGGIGIHEVDRMLLGQIAYGGVTGHEERALRQGLEVRARLRLIPGVDGHSTVMAAQAQVADCELAADVRRCGPHAVTAVNAVAGNIGQVVVPQQVAGTCRSAAELMRDVTEVTECVAGAAQLSFEIMGR